MNDFEEAPPRRRGPRGGGRRRGGGPFGRPGGWQQADLPGVDDAAAWFGGRLPEGWFADAPTVTADRDEIVVVGRLTAPEVADGSDAGAVTAAALGRIGRFREETRDERMQIADEAEARYHRKVAWGVRIGDEHVMFTHAAVPVMTRLRQPERRVLDTLVDAGVARSRSEALAWCVKLVGEHTEQWLADLRNAMAAVEEVRTAGPTI